MTISEYLSRLKEEKSLTQQQIAELSGVPMGTVSRILAGQVECPSFQAVADMTRALGGSLDELAGIERKKRRTAHPMSDTDATRLTRTSLPRFTESRLTTRTAGYFCCLSF